MVVVLPAAFGPRKAKNSPGGDIERQIVHRLQVAEAFGQVPYLDHCRRLILRGERVAEVRLCQDDLAQLRHVKIDASWPSLRAMAT